MFSILRARMYNITFRYSVFYVGLRIHILMFLWNFAGACLVGKVSQLSKLCYKNRLNKRPARASEKSLSKSMINSCDRVHPGTHSIWLYPVWPYSQIFGRIGFLAELVFWPYWFFGRIDILVAWLFSRNAILCTNCWCTEMDSTSTYKWFNY